MRKIFWYILLIFIIIAVITLVVIVNEKVEIKNINSKDETKEKLSKLNNIDKKIDYFKYSYIDRYLSYKEKYPNLDDIDIVTRVNLNLDYNYYENTKQTNLLNKNNILINKYIYLPEDYIPNNLVAINEEFSLPQKMLIYEAKEAFEKMAKQAKNEGYTIRVISAYRSYEYQKNLYDNYVKEDGQIKADTYSARPGYSEHQTGLVIDIDNKKVNYENFEITEEFKWMTNNAYKYGYILRYPKNKENITGYNYESWHYRYVGKEIAKYIYENNITLDEYFVRFIDK